MAWFHKQSAAYWQLCFQMRSLLGAGHKHRQGIMLDTSVKTHWVWRRMAASRPQSSGHPVWGGCLCFELCYLAGGAAMQLSTQGTEELNDACVSVCACSLVLLSAQCQGGVNGLSAISGTQHVYPNEHNSKSSQLQRMLLLWTLLQSWKIPGEINIHENNAGAPHSTRVKYFCGCLHAFLPKQ